MLGNSCGIVQMVPGVDTVIVTAGGMGGNSDHLLFTAVQILALAIAKVMQYKAGESIDNFYVGEMCEKQNEYLQKNFGLIEKINFIIRFKALICTRIHKR